MSTQNPIPIFWIGSQTHLWITMEIFITVSIALYHLVKFIGEKL